MRKILMILILPLLITPALAKADPPPQCIEPDTVNRADAELVAKTLYGECRGVESMTEQAAVCWVILNRVDADGYACGGSIEDTIIFPYQFQGYDADNPVTDELYSLACDVLDRWKKEKQGEDAGRVLPKDYMWFEGDGEHNYFYDADGNLWDFSLESPYED